jgi:hypothetical protein
VRNIPQIFAMFTEVLWSTEAPFFAGQKRMTASKTGKTKHQVLPRSGRPVATVLKCCNMLIALFASIDSSQPDN